ncbi:MAG: type II CAAX endopeptidase family protein [Candidatus Sulfotelmatobacter sp.]
MSEPEIPPSSPTPAVSSFPNTIFRGPNGIRAGWRVVIFFAISAALMFVCFAALRLFTGRNAQLGFSELTPFGLGLSEGLILFFTAIPALIMARIENRSFGEYGLPARSAFRRNFWIGTLAGFVAISACLLAIFALHGFRLTGMGVHGETIIWATAAWCATFVIVGLAEEFSFRGYLQYTLTTGVGFWPSAIFLSLLFGFVHKGNPGWTKFGLLSVVIFGLLFCLFLRRTGNLWWAVGFHAGWDWGQTFFYGVPDSGILPYHNLLNCSFSGPNWLTGGSVGPEASVFTPIVLAVVAVLFVRVYRENQYKAG